MAYGECDESTELLDRRHVVMRSKSCWISPFILVAPTAVTPAEFVRLHSGDFPAVSSVNLRTGGSATRHPIDRITNAPPNRPNSFRVK